MLLCAGHAGRSRLEQRAYPTVLKSPGCSIVLPPRWSISTEILPAQIVSPPILRPSPA